MNKLFEKSRGQVMVLYSIAFAFALCGAIAMGTDVAVMYVNWQRAQKTVDAAVLSGANYLNGGTTSGGLTYTGTVTPGCTGESSSDPASEAACTYAVDNGLPAGTVTISDTTTNIKVVATQSGLPYFFAKALGMSTYTVSASASAVAPGPVGTVNNDLFPIGLQCPSATAPAGTTCDPSSLVAGQSLSFGSKFVSVGASGNWQWLDDSNGKGGGDSLLSEAIAGTAPPASFTVGGPIASEPGNKGNSGPVKSALASRLASCPSIADPCSGGGNPTDIPAGDPCLVITPIVNFKGCTGSCTLTILGFAEVYLEPATTTSTSINGCFVSTVAGDTLTTSTAQNFGPNSAPVLSQ